MRRGLELPVQALERDPQLLQVGGTDLGEGLPVPGDTSQELTTARPRYADRLVHLTKKVSRAVEQCFAREREFNPVRGTSQQIAADQPF